ncbi:MAG TPA: DUF2088 domain-containing protein, partial [Proteobacteria bacterium]|nr:DUF2088 domain-containing protein [Pseudomonadota bacterium]
MGNDRVSLLGGRVVFELPKSWEVIGELEPVSTSKLYDIQNALLYELNNPIGCDSLASFDLSSRKIVIAVEDISRPAPLHLFFGFLMDYLFSYGARIEDIRIINALGVHRAMSQDEVERKLGRDAVEGIAWINHDCEDMDGHVEIGTPSRGTRVLLNRHLVEADLIICVGTIEPHPLLGFGGGLKMILPGLAHRETIAQNHMQGVSPDRYNYIGVLESPMRLDLEEAVQMLGKDIFIVNAIMNENLDVCRFVCGDPIEAHREGAKFVESLCAREIRELADVAIVASSPMNADLRQGMKCIANVEQ